MNNKLPHLLFVEDDQSIGFITMENLERKGYTITWYKDGEQAFRAFQPGKFDLCLFDIMLPAFDGISLAREVRKIDENIPILFLTAKSLQEDKILGLISGADDYIVKPFSIEELVLRIEIFLKRSKKYQKDTANFKIGHFQMNMNTLTLSNAEQTIRLTYREAELLKFLFQKKNKLVSREDILTALWKENDYFLGRSLDVFISRLRKYLKNDPSIRIENVHGVGFILKTESEY
ncbi:MAG: response regulator transcription factor [Bacteroidales bacterium]|nr:response regulator transcription factor [Bacteroidales bacterium]